MQAGKQCSPGRPQYGRVSLRGRCRYWNERKGGMGRVKGSPVLVAPALLPVLVSLLGVPENLLMKPPVRYFRSAVANDLLATVTLLIALRASFSMLCSPWSHSSAS